MGLAILENLREEVMLRQIASELGGISDFYSVQPLQDTRKSATWALAFRSFVEKCVRRC